jgi:hypothetical protein
MNGINESSGKERLKEELTWARRRLQISYQWQVYKVSEEGKGNLPNPGVTYCIWHWLYSNSILVKR